MLIDNALRDFVDAFHKSKNSLGIMDYTPNEQDNSSINFSLNGEVSYFYSHLILKDGPTFGGDFFLQFIEKEKSDAIQEGWRVTGETPDWNENYIIIADRNGDALFCDLSDKKSPVFGSVQKEIYSLSGTLSEFLNVYSKLIKIEEEEFLDETTDDNLDYKSEYLSRIEAELNKNISSKFTDDFMYFFFG